VTSGKDTAGPPPQAEAAVAGETAPVPAGQQPPVVGGDDATEVHDLSKDDYVRTTSDAPDHTALIPAIRDEPAETALTPTVAPPVAAAVSSPAPIESVRAWSEPTPAPTVASSDRSEDPKVNGGRTGGLRLVRVEPYSVTRLAFVVSVALMIVSVVAAAIFWIMLAVTGVWGQINDSVASLLSDDSASFDIKDYVGFGRVVGGTLVLSGINVILMTGLATVGAHLYNLAAALLGGVDVTFTDE
jgi:hypothetical protein